MPKEKDMMQMTFRTSINTAFKENKLGSIESVPYGNKESVKILLGEEKAYEFINSVKLGEDNPAFPDPWTKVVLTTEWAESFAAKVNTTPQPMFIPGHAEYGVSSKERVIPDGYLTGALVMGDELFIRNSMPAGKTELKKDLVQQTANEIEAKMLSTSTSSYNKYDLELDDEGDATYFAREAVKGLSNALVEADQTGSDAEIVVTSFKAGDGFEINNKGEDRMEGKTPTTVEMFTSLKNQIDSGRLALSEVATSLGIDVMTSGQKTALKRLNDAESKVGDITEFVTKVVADREASFVSLKESKIKDKFKTDELIEIATPLFSLKEGTVEDIDKEVDRISELGIFKKITGRIADGSEFTPGGGSEDKTDDNSGSMEA